MIGITNKTENILEIIEKHFGEITIQRISELTSFAKEDIISVLKEVNMLNCYKGVPIIKYRPQSIRKYLEQFRQRQATRKNVFNPEHLHWQPKVIDPKLHPWKGMSSFH